MTTVGRRAALCVPASEPAKITKALALDVDEVVVDLEDAVAVAAKNAARENVAQLAGRDLGCLTVRINATTTGWWRDDLAACAGNAAITSVVVPKVETPEDLVAVSGLLGQVEAAVARTTPLELQALIESPAGLANVSAIAGSPRLVALVIGYADLAASLGRRPEASWQFAKDAVLLAARVHGIQAIDGPELTVQADEPFRERAEGARALGFDGKWVIHPRQVATVQAAFTPSDAEVQHAREILTAMDEAAREGRGATQFEGRMLDEAVAQQARGVLSRTVSR